MIETQRLTIRRFAPGDWNDLYEYLSDPVVVFYEPYGVFTEDECRREAAGRSKNSAFWAVCLKSSQKVIGNIYLSKQEYDTWELGYVFNAAYQGNGYATESARAVVSHAITSCGARRIVAMCNPENEKSWRLLERLKMRREGHLKQNIYFKTDHGHHPLWQDTYEYGILSDEWGLA
jgi:[ribosomal protein S5]-alanine N-acetyltransferase